MTFAALLLARSIFFTKSGRSWSDLTFTARPFCRLAYLSMAESSTFILNLSRPRNTQGGLTAATE